MQVNLPTLVRRVALRREGPPRVLRSTASRVTLSHEEHDDNSSLKGKAKANDYGAMYDEQSGQQLTDERAHRG